MSEFDKALQLINKAETILISGHINPDGDSIGSMLALGSGLELLKKKVVMLSVDGVPRTYQDLPGADSIVAEYSGSPDLAISVDVSTEKMLGDAYGVFKKARHIIEIDHHTNRKSFGGLVIIEPETAAVGEVVFKLLNKLSVAISREIAENIMTSIIVETHSFRLPNVKPQTFNICYKLLSAGVDYHQLTERVYWRKSKEAAILTGICLSRCKFRAEGKLAWSIIKKSDFDEVGGSYEDLVTVAGELISIKNVEAAVFFAEENGNRLKVSLRSKGSVNVGLLADNLGGGGHYDIAGCYAENTAEGIQKILNDVEGLL